MTSSKTVLFIHGMFMNNTCWNEWVDYFQKNGFATLAPSWPFHEGVPETLRKEHPNKSLGSLTLNDVVRFFKNIVTALPEPPILIGHSMGGLVVQLLLNKGYGACGIAIDSAPPAGVITFEPSFFKANFPIVNPFKGNSPDLMSFERFQYCFVNGFSLEEQRKAYNAFVIPESRNVPRSSTLGAGMINFKKQHSPLLLIAGSKDNIIPASLNRTNFKKYKHSESKIEFKEFEGRTHFIIGQKNWREVADYITKWITSL